jgi:2'-5' RNA ligase
MYIVIAPIPEDLTAAVQPYRQRYDPLVKALPAHITVLNPFEFSGSPEILYKHLTEIGENHAPIKTSIAGWDIYHQIDYQLRLPVIAGRVEFTELREDLLTGPLKYCPGQDKDYWPHIHLGQFTTEVEVIELKKVMSGFEPQFIFRVTHLELLRWDKPGYPWMLEKRFGLEATLMGAGRKKEPRTSSSSNLIL